MKRPIFLSASVPVREPFASDFDAIAIREAVLALVSVVVRERPIIFGGHPAISPLVEHAARSLGAVENVHIYQSRYFEQVIPEAARRFDNLHWTPAIMSTGRELQASLTAMRIEMISSWEFSASVVIGGMEGIFEEVDLFRQYHRLAPVIPIGSTGGAAKLILQRELNRWNEDIKVALNGEHRYRRLFRLLLPQDP